MEKELQKNATEPHEELLQPEKLKEMDVVLYKRQETIDKKIVGGRLLLWKESKDLVFVQNAPRGARSVEIGRTSHGRVVRQPSGKYSVRFVFSIKERSVRYQLLSEMREAAKIAEENSKSRKEWK